MWDTSPWYKGGRYLIVIKDHSCLLIGNSRWHWAIKKADQWQFFHSSSESKKLQFLKSHLLAWAAVGAIPKHQSLKQSLKIEIEDIPLLNTPAWLGIDRALAAWGAFKKATQTGTMPTQGLLIADAGTVLSLTRIQANGEFIGGQLIAGFKLQLEAMGTKTQNLLVPSYEAIPSETFPITTSDAMLKGTLQSLIGTLIEANKESNVPIWLCGGDAPIIIQELKIKNHNLPIFHYPNLVMEGMLDLTN